MLFILSCSNRDRNFFKYSLDDYIDNHPLNLLYEVDSLQNRILINCTYPFYQVVFHKDSTDNIHLEISQKMYYFQSEEKENKVKKFKGYFLHEQNYVFVYDINDASENHLFTNLTTAIPDSIIYDFEKCRGQILHNSNNVKNYKLRTK